MGEWNRRSVMVSSAALATGTALAAAGTSSANDSPAASVPTEPSGWSSHGGTIGNCRHVPATDGFERPDTIAWRYDHSGPAAAVDGAVYLQTEGELHSLDASDGSRRWIADGIDAAGTPAVVGGVVYVAGEGVTAFDAETGDRHWNVSFDGAKAVSAPVVANGTVYTSADGTLRALDAETGDRRWERETVDVAFDGESETGPGEVAYGFHSSDGTVAVADDTVWALLDEERTEDGADADAVAALDPATGEVLGATHLSSGRIASGLAATEDALFVETPSEEGVVVLDPGSREVVDTVSDAFDSAAVGGTAVTHGRHTLSSTGADAPWNDRETHAYGKPTIVGDLVVVAHSRCGRSSPDELVGFDLEDGSERWTFAFDDRHWCDGFPIDAVVEGETIYVDRDGQLTAVRPS
ncbi:outer membrane protein assembly factor BamB family protein [Natronococcus occultus]|uniref:PQQ repeat protein n=1 Tax=Natronococcus occultus SP4 TaxID=694430 RepID=L0K4P6_9EURY|nr:PQQ-binding-like beta-propeller repeat protein [Natronococcus occultus]AGB39530.1 PQQ repeat protein [Natronococcus occultus SP4]